MKTIRVVAAVIKAVNKTAGNFREEKSKKVRHRRKL